MPNKRKPRKYTTPNLDDFPTAIAEELRYRQPMRVSEIMVLTLTHGQTGFAICPRCKLTMEYDYVSFCGRCGQHLDWSRYRHAALRTPEDHEGSN